MKIHIIGDVHGKVMSLASLVNPLDKDDLIFQVGDLGFEHSLNKTRELLKHPNFFVVPGNHDYFPEVGNAPYLNMVEDFIVDNNTLMTIGGANSIDKYHRIEGRDWFRDEEITYAASISILENHSFTRKFLDALFEIHQPDGWFFGHHHKSMEGILNGTYFKCLNELEKITIEW